MNDDLIKSDNWKTSDTKALISELRNSLSVQALPASSIGKSILESYIKGFTSSAGKWDTSSLVSAAALSGNIAKQSIEISSAAGIAHLVSEELTKSISSSFNTESANTFENFSPPNEEKFVHGSCKIRYTSIINYGSCLGWNGKYGTFVSIP